MKNLLTFIILFFNSFLYAQDSWIFDDENADIGAYIRELKQFKEESILSLSYAEDFNVIKEHDLNTGEIINEVKLPMKKIIEGLDFRILFKQFFLNYDSELVYIFGRVNYFDTVPKSYLSVTKLDFDLNFVSDTFYKVSDSCGVCDLYTKKYEDEYCVFMGVCQQNNPEDSYDLDNFPPLIARFDLNANLIDTLHINEIPKFCDNTYYLILKKEDDKGYWAFNHTCGEQIASYDNLFNLIELIEIPFKLDNGINIDGNRFDDSSYVVGFPFWSNSNDGHGTQIVKFDNNMNVLKRDTLVPKNLGIFTTFYYDPIDWYYKEHIYTGGFYLASQVSFCISKYDSDLNLVWRKFIGYEDEYKYYMISMEATSDSCIVVGGNRKKYDSNTKEWIRKPLIMKISPEGNTVSTDDFEKSDWSITVYPNPSSGDFKLYVEGSHKSAKLHISDMQGRQIKVINDIKQGDNSFNFSNLPKGMYIWTLEDKGGVIGSGKWVKE